MILWHNLKIRTLIKYDQCLSSRELFREVKKQMEGNGWRGWEEGGISWVTEIQSNWDGQVEKLGDLPLIGTLIEPGRIPHQHWGVRLKSAVTNVPSCSGKRRMCLINGWNKVYVKRIRQVQGSVGKNVTLVHRVESGLQGPQSIQ